LRTPFFLEPHEAKLHEASQTFWFARKRKLYQRKITNCFAIGKKSCIKRKAASQRKMVPKEKNQLLLELGNKLVTWVRIPVGAKGKKWQKGN